MNTIEKLQNEQLRTDLVKFKVGDNVRVHTRIKEGDRERIQVFSGLVIGRQGSGIRSTFTVRLPATEAACWLPAHWTARMPMKFALFLPN